MNNLIPLILSARTGDKIAYNAIVMRFQDMAVGYAYSILKDFHLSQDVAQEAFVAAFRDLPDLRSPGGFPAWLKSIVFKHCDRMTRKKKHELVSIDTTILASKDMDPLSQIEKEESRKRILLAINNLPEEEREAITLFYIGEHTHADIAHFLNLSEATINNRLSSARKRLKKGLIGMAKETMRQQAPSRDNAFMKRIADMLENAWAIRRAENYEEGRRILKEAEALCAENDNQSWGRIYAIYAQYDRDNGNLASALELSKISLGYYEKSGNQQCIAHSIRHIADIQSGLKNDQEAEENYQKALSIYRENPETNTLDLANAVRPYGILLKKLGRADEARPLLLEAKKLYQKVGIQAGVDEMHSLLNTSSKV